MKKIFVFLCMIFPLVVFSQRPAKVFLNILDIYLENELPRAKSRYHLDKDKVLVRCSTDTIMNKRNKPDYCFFYSIYNLEDLPEVDSMKMYKGVRMSVSYPKEMEKKLSRHFKPIKDSSEEPDPLIRTETVCNLTIQMNEKYEIYYFITKDDISYYEKLRKKRIKFAEKVISINPLPVKQ